MCVYVCVCVCVCVYLCVCVCVFVYLCEYVGRDLSSSSELGGRERVSRGTGYTGGMDLLELLQ